MISFIIHWSDKYISCFFLLRGRGKKKRKRKKRKKKKYRRLKQELVLNFKGNTLTRHHLPCPSAAPQTALQPAIDKKQETLAKKPQTRDTDREWEGRGAERKTDKKIMILKKP